MNILEIFLHAWRERWWFLCGTTMIFLVVLVGRFASSRTFFNDTKSFPELGAFSKDDQQRLLREASREAFSALSFVPPLIALAFFWVGFTLALTLVKVTARVVLTCLFVVFGGWLARRLEAHRVRPFLKKLIDGQNGKSVA
jgi:hypothetical protein